MKRTSRSLVIKRKKRRTTIDWSKIAVTNTIPLNGEQIADEIERQTGIKSTRQNISNALKSGLKKFYIQLKKDHPELSPFQRAVKMVEMLFPDYVCNDSFRGGIDAFFNLLPPEIKKRVMDDAKNYKEGKEGRFVMRELYPEIEETYEGTNLL